MKNIPKKLLTILAILIACGLTWNYYFPQATWRYKITITVDTPEGIKTGSAVRETYAMRGLSLLTGTGGRARTLKGEAVVVDLGQRGVLFAPLDVNDYRIVFEVFAGSARGLTAQGIRYYKNLKDVRSEIPKELYPRLVKFDDLNDPSSVKKVNPNNLAASFGRGIALKAITLEMTEEPVKFRIRSLLPWIDDYYDMRLDGDNLGNFHAKNQIANDLASGSFLVGDRK